MDHGSTAQMPKCLVVFIFFALRRACDSYLSADHPQLRLVCSLTCLSLFLQCVTDALKNYPIVAFSTLITQHQKCASLLVDRWLDLFSVRPKTPKRQNARLHACFLSTCPSVSPVSKLIRRCSSPQAPGTCALVALAVSTGISFASNEPEQLKPRSSRRLFPLASYQSPEPLCTSSRMEETFLQPPFEALGKAPAGSEGEDPGEACGA